MQVLPANRQPQSGTPLCNFAPRPSHRLSTDVSQADSTPKFASSVSIDARSSLPAHPSRPLRKHLDNNGPCVSDRLSQPAQGADTVSPPQTLIASTRNVAHTNIYSSQCVSQRHALSEDMRYVFKDGIICPAVIDGEPVNPQWRTTKAGKARKSLDRHACRLNRFIVHKISNNEI
jgi:hypothetical protein